MLKLQLKKKRSLKKKNALEKAKLRILKRIQQNSASPVPIIEKKEKKKKDSTPVDPISDTKTGKAIVNKIDIDSSNKKKAKTKVTDKKKVKPKDKAKKKNKLKVKSKKKPKNKISVKKKNTKNLKKKEILYQKIKYKPQKVKLFSQTKARYFIKKNKKVKIKRMSRRFYLVKKRFRFDLFYNFLFLKKAVSSVLVKGLKKKTQATIFKSFFYLKKNKKLSFLVFFKLLILLRVPLYFKPVYRSGELFTVPVPLSYLKQWFMCFKLLKKLEKSVRFGSFLNKLEGEYSYLYNDIFLNLPKIRRNINAKTKFFSPFKFKKKVMPSSFLLHLFLSKNAAILDNSSYFHYRW